MSLRFILQSTVKAAADVLTQKALTNDKIRTRVLKPLAEAAHTAKEMVKNQKSPFNEEKGVSGVSDFVGGMLAVAVGAAVAAYEKKDQVWRESKKVAAVDEIFNSLKEKCEQREAEIAELKEKGSTMQARVEDLQKEIAELKILEYNRIRLGVAAKDNNN